MRWIGRVELSVYVTNSAKGHRAADAVERLLRESDGGNAGRRVFGAAGAAASHYQDGALKGGADQAYVSAWRDACETTGESLSRWARSREDACLVESVRLKPGKDVSFVGDPDFHGVDPHWGVDHVLIVGSAVFYIDSRPWSKRAAYKWVDGVLMSGKDEADEPMPFVVANAEAFGGVMPDDYVRTQIVHCPSEKFSVVAHERAWFEAPVQVCDSDRFIKRVTMLVDEQLSEYQKGFLDAAVVAKYAVRATKPYDKFAKLRMKL